MIQDWLCVFKLNPRLNSSAWLKLFYIGSDLLRLVGYFTDLILDTSILYDSEPQNCLPVPTLIVPAGEMWALEGLAGSRYAGAQKVKSGWWGGGVGFSCHKPPTMILFFLSSTLIMTSPLSEPEYRMAAEERISKVSTQDPIHVCAGIV